MKNYTLSFFSIAVSLAFMLGIVENTSGQSIPQTFTASGTWVAPEGVTQVEVFIVAGGGGGGSRSRASGGGGAGGVIIQTVNVTPGQSYPIVVGAGGAGGLSTVAGQRGANGSNSSAFGLIALGGGGGGGYTNGADPNINNGAAGGSGGGAGGDYASNIASVPGLGNVPQGNNGGNYFYSNNNGSGGGGGGAGGPGGNGVNNSTPGTGGPGITYNSVEYARGGIGGASSLSGGGANGTANSGNGGGGANGTGQVAGGNGGSGIVIITYAPIYQSRQTGNWNNTDTWEQFVAGSWTNTSNFPTAHSSYVVNGPTIEATATYQTNSTITSHSVTLPSGIQAGDLLIMVFRAGSTQTATTPSGWSLLSFRNNNGYTYVWQKTAAGNEGSTVTVTTGSTIRAAAITYRISRWQGTPAIAFTGSNTNDPPSLSPSWGTSSPTLFIAAMTNRRSDNDVISTPINYADLITISQTSDNNTNRSRVSSAHRFLTAASEDPLAFIITGTIESPHSLTIAVRGTSETFYPKSHATIRNAHTVSVTANQTADDVVVESGGTLTVNNNITLDISEDSEIALQSGGLLKMVQASAITGQGAFTLNSGATIEIGSPNGITASGASGNIQNTGTRSFNTGANYTYNGTAAQATGNGLPATVNNLTLNNSAGLSLTGSTTVNGTLGLTAGLLSPSGNNLTIAAAGNVIGASPTSYVNGALLRQYSTTGSKEFAVGKDGKYRPITLQYATLDAISTVSAEVITGLIPGSIPTSVNAFEDRYWSVSQTGAGSFSYFLTLQDGDFEPENEVFILKGDGSTVAYFETTTPDYTNATAFTSFSDFGLGEQACIQPELDQPDNVTECVSYTLPATSSIKGTNLVAPKYYDNSQANSGQEITNLTLTTTQTVWIYDEYNNDPGCSDEVSFVVTINALPTFTLTPADISCFGAGDGAIAITPAGGSGSGYQYRWRSRANELSSWSDWSGWINITVDFDNLGPADYQVEVRDSNGCVQTNCN